MLINRSPGIRSSEITPESVYRSRREFLRTAAAGAVGAYAGASLLDEVLSAQAMIPNVKKSPLSTDEPRP
jgi:sulfoxide reductase catalytic subunit YedY